MEMVYILITLYIYIYSNFLNGFRPKRRENKAGQFVDPRYEQIYNEVIAQIEDRQTQLTQQSPDGIPVTLSTLEVDQIYEEVKFHIFFKILIIIIHLM